ncbi:MAG: nitroreductase family protein [Patescibacteria group bacterium]
MDISEAIKNRRSIRNFSDQAVDRDLVKKLVEAATCAPSACNVQGWKFIIVDDPEIKKRLVDEGGSVLIGKAPLGVLVVYNNQTHNLDYADHIQSASAAIQNLLLTATDLGLGACWICHLPSAGSLRKIFNIPRSFSPIAYIIVGHPKSQSQLIPRKYRLDEIMEYNRFSSVWPKLKTSHKLKIKRLLIKVYNLTPLFIKKKILNKIVDKKFVKKFDN